LFILSLVVALFFGAMSSLLIFDLNLPGLGSHRSFLVGACVRLVTALPDNEDCISEQAAFSCACLVTLDGD